MLVYMPSPYWMRRSTKAAKLALRRGFSRPRAWPSDVSLSLVLSCLFVSGIVAGTGSSVVSRRLISPCRWRRRRLRCFWCRSVCPAGADQAGLVGDDDQLRPVPGAELRHRPGGVGLGGGDAQVELVGDLLVGQAAGDQRDDF